MLFATAVTPVPPYGATRLVTLGPGPHRAGERHFAAVGRHGHPLGTFFGAPLEHGLDLRADIGRGGEWLQV